jgi:hypothetical protein
MQGDVVEHIILRLVPKSKVVIYFGSSRTKRVLERSNDSDTHIQIHSGHDDEIDDAMNEPQIH